MIALAAPLRAEIVRVWLARSTVGLLLAPGIAAGLRIVEAKGPDKRSRYQFTLTVNLKKPKVEGEEGAEGAVEADAAAQGAAS